MRILLIALLFSAMYLKAECLYLDCTQQVLEERTKTQEALRIKFEELKAELKILQKTYEKELKQLKANNKELEIQLAIKKDTLLKDKEYIFLLKQFNELQSNQNSENTIQKD